MKNAFVFLLVMLALSASAQTTKKQLGQNICDCINEAKIDVKNVEKSQLQENFGRCFMIAYSKLDKKQQDELNINFDDKAEAKKFGVEVAMEMASLCPDILLAIGLNTSQNKSEGESVVDEDAASEAPDPTIACSFVELQKGQFLSLVGKDANGRTHTFLFLWDFGSISLITDNLIRKNDRIEVTYSEYEFYDPALKDFRSYKIISGLRKL